MRLFQRIRKTNCHYIQNKIYIMDAKGRITSEKGEKNTPASLSTAAYWLEVTDAMSSKHSDSALFNATVLDDPKRTVLRVGRTTALFTQGDTYSLDHNGYIKTKLGTKAKPSHHKREWCFSDDAPPLEDLGSIVRTARGNHHFEKNKVYQLVGKNPFCVLDDSGERIVVGSGQGEDAIHRSMYWSHFNPSKPVRKAIRRGNSENGFTRHKMYYLKGKRVIDDNGVKRELLLPSTNWDIEEEPLAGDTPPKMSEAVSCVAKYYQERFERLANVTDETPIRSDLRTTHHIKTIPLCDTPKPTVEDWGKFSDSMKQQMEKHGIRTGTLHNSKTEDNYYMGVSNPFINPFKDYQLRSFDLVENRGTINCRCSSKPFDAVVAQAPDGRVFLKAAQDDQFGNYPTKSEREKMLKIETVTQIDGRNSVNYSNEDLLQLIEGEEKNLKRFAAFDSKSKNIEKMIKRHQKNIDALIKLLDANDIED